MASTELLVADALDVALASALAPIWGIYLNGNSVFQRASQLGDLAESALSPFQEVASSVGVPNILPAIVSTIDFEFNQDWPISDYQQERGAFQSYDKITLPFDVKVRLAAGGSPSNRQNFLSTCLAISASFSIFDVVTPETTFTNCNVTHINWNRSSRQGVTLIVIDLWFKQIPVTSAPSFTNTADPTDSSAQSLGNLQPQPPSSSTQSSFVAFLPQ